MFQQLGLQIETCRRQHPQATGRGAMAWAGLPWSPRRGQGVESGHRSSFQAQKQALLWDPLTCWLLSPEVHQGSREEVCLQEGQRELRGQAGTEGRDRAARDGPRHSLHLPPADCPEDHGCVPQLTQGSDPTEAVSSAAEPVFPALWAPAPHSGRRGRRGACEKPPRPSLRTLRQPTPGDGQGP